MNTLPIPEIGKEYHFWDDGKSAPGRHYICRCERVIKTKKEAKNVKFMLKHYDGFTKDSSYTEYETSLYDIWKNEVKQYDWLIAEDTDAFVELSCPRYDENNLWAVRTKYGGWFTMNIQSSWQCGYVDATGEKFDNIISSLETDNEYERIQEYVNEKYGKK